MYIYVSVEADILGATFARKVSINRNILGFDVHELLLRTDFVFSYDTYYFLRF